MKNKKGFTLVELLAVIVILSVIIVIAVPKIMGTVTNSKKASLETATLSIISGAEKLYLENQLLGIKQDIKCSDVAKMQSNVYGACKITFDSEGNATVILNGKKDGKFDNLACSGTKEGVTCKEGSIELDKGLKCTFDVEMVQGAEFVHNQYTYRYKQEYMIDMESGESEWINISNDGWGVILTDKTSTDPVNTPICSSINGKPLVSTTFMFFEKFDSDGNPIFSQTTEIDVSEWDTSKVTNMSGMLAFTMGVTEIKGLENLDTSNVTNMMFMFMGSVLGTLDMNGEDFDPNGVRTLNLSRFNTSNVTNMMGMFVMCGANTLDLSSFNTRNVTDMSYMFENNAATILDLSSFDTSNVTDMSGMFQYSAVSTLDLSSFDTSNVTDMSYMFENSAATILDLSSFDTSNVTDMSGMFSNSAATALDLRSFDTRNVTDMSYMFRESVATVLDLSSFDTSKVTNMIDMFINAKATVGYARTQADADKFNDFDVTWIPDTLTFTLKSS